MAGSRFEGKVGVVTGGASGIGLAIVRRLVAEGARCVAADVNQQALEALRAKPVATIQCPVGQRPARAGQLPNG